MGPNASDASLPETSRLTVSCKILWIFGYGSLVCRPGFSYSERQSARLYAYARRFWQGSTDHRGIPGAPGRVVTLVPDSESYCDGVAYRVAFKDKEVVLAGLDHRERGGYVREWVRLELRDFPGKSLKALMYRATPSNPNYLGPASLPEIAAQIMRSQGPSGRNLDYVLELAAAVRLEKGADRHLFDLEEILLSQI